VYDFWSLSEISKKLANNTKVLCRSFKDVKNQKKASLSCAALIIMVSIMYASVGGGVMGAPGRLAATVCSTQRETETRLRFSVINWDVQLSCCNRDLIVQSAVVGGLQWPSSVLLHFLCKQTDCVFHWVIVREWTNIYLIVYWIDD